MFSYIMKGCVNLGAKLVVAHKNTYYRFIWIYKCAFYTDPKIMIPLPSES